MLLVFLSAACSQQSLDDFQEEGEGITRQLAEELQRIRTRDNLLEHAANLQVLFLKLSDVMIRAQEFKDTHPNAAPATKSSEASEQLRIQINRILNMEGGREVLEKAQDEALNRLDAFEKGRRE